MEVKFGKNEVVDVESTVTVAPVVTESVAVAAPVVENTNTNTSVATTGGTFKLGDKLPGFKDVILPRLQIAFAVGELGKSFPAGSIIFNKDTLLYSPAVIDVNAGTITRAALPPVTILVVGIVSERFSEKVEGGFGGEIVNTEAEVRAAGGTLDYKEWQLKRDEGMRRFEPLVDLLIAIEKPAHITDPDGAIFGFPVGNTSYAIGFWGCKSTSYTEAVKSGFNRHRLTGVLRGGYYTHTFNLSTRPKSFTTPKGTFSAPIPVVTPKAKSTPEILEFVRSIVGA